MRCNMRVGNGYDVHPLVKGKSWCWGSQTSPFEKGLSGWSDADSLTHAVIGALWGRPGPGR